MYKWHKYRFIQSLIIMIINIKWNEYLITQHRTKMGKSKNRTIDRREMFTPLIPLLFFKQHTGHIMDILHRNRQKKVLPTVLQSAVGLTSSHFQSSFSPQIDAKTEDVLLERQPDTQNTRFASSRRAVFVVVVVVCKWPEWSWKPLTVSCQSASEHQCEWLMQTEWLQ